MERYIDQNPHRANLRRATNFCKCHTYQAKDGKTWWYYGNLELVKLPTILAVECSRKIQAESALWGQWQSVASHMTSGCAGIGTFMSPCEKMVQSTILASGGALIILLPQGISPYWHPGEEMEKLCVAAPVFLRERSDRPLIEAKPSQLTAACAELKNAAGSQ